MVMIVADEVGFDGFDEPLQVFAVTQHGAVVRANPGKVLGITDTGAVGGVGAHTELLLVGVSGKQVDVGKVGGITLAQVGHQPAKRSKSPRAGLVGQIIGFHRGMRLHPRDQGIEFSPFGRVVQHVRVQEVAGEHRTQAVALRGVQAVRRGPGKIEPLGGDPREGFIRGGRRAPESDDELFGGPGRTGALAGIRGVGTEASPAKE